MKLNFTKKESIKKLIFIFKRVEKKFIKSSLILLVSMIGAGICELLVLMSLSNFLSVILKNEKSLDVITSNNLENSNNFYSQLIDLTNNFTGSDIVSNCILFILIALFTFFVKLFTLNVGLKLTAKIASSIEGKCGEAIMSLPYEDSKNLNCPEVITQFNHIARFTHGFIQNGIQSLSALFLIFFIFYYLTTMVDGYFLLALVALISIYSLVFISYRKRFKVLSKKRNFYEKFKISSITYMVRMFRYIIIEKGRKNVSNGYYKTASNLYELNSDSQFLVQYPKIVIEYGAIIIVSILIIVQSFLYGGLKSIENTGIFLVAILRLLPSLQIIYLYLSKLKKDSYVIDSVFKLLTLPVEKENNYDEDNSVNLSENNEKIESVELKNICFKYSHSESNTIDDLSITFHKGKSYAIVGSSGSGKSTLIDIFLNLLHPQEGKVLINGKYIMDTKKGGDYVTTFLRSNTLLLGQNDFYTGDRIKHLLELNSKELKINNLEEKLEFGICSLNLENIFERGGLDAFIGENGSKISGGQRQRLLILKAFLSNKTVFIFDEATSSLDSYSKKLVTNLLFSKSFFTSEKTLIFSTHSDSVSKLCNQIIRMN